MLMGCTVSFTARAELTRATVFQKRKLTHPNTHISCNSDTHASIYLYEVELSPAESIGDGGKRGYPQEEKHAKSQYPRRVERVTLPGPDGVKLFGLVLLHLKVTVNKAERYL